MNTQLTAININEQLLEIQQSLTIAKGATNDFGGYNYRTAEGILFALKPKLKKTGCTLLLTDEIIEVCGRAYIKATVKLANLKGESISTTANAREAVIQKGMVDAQISGSSSSYARKYALCGLFAIDSNEDVDARDYLANLPFNSYEEMESLLAQANTGDMSKALNGLSTLQIDFLFQYVANERKSLFITVSEEFLAKDKEKYISKVKPELEKKIKNATTIKHLSEILKTVKREYKQDLTPMFTARKLEIKNQGSIRMYSQEEFDTHAVAWKEVVKMGRKTPEELMIMAGTKSKLTDKMIKEITNWGNK